jgi:hypothetical protein
LLAFYGDHDLRVVPEVPDQFPATVNPLPDWQTRAGVLTGPRGQSNTPAVTDCPQRMHMWLEAQGQKADPITITVKSEGIRFPLDKPFAYLVFEYLPKQP